MIDQLESWPEADQNELVEVIRQIEARRTGVYVMSADERAAVEEARRDGFASDAEMEALWRRFGVK